MSVDAQVSKFFSKARTNHAQIYWLLDILYMGTKIRIADDSLIIKTNPGPDGDHTLYDNKIKNIYYRDGLQVKSGIISDIDLNLWSRSGRTIKAQIEICGHEELQKLDPIFGLSEGQAELALWIKGTYFEDRFIVL